LLLHSLARTKSHSRAPAAPKNYFGERLQNGHSWHITPQEAVIVNRPQLVQADIEKHCKALSLRKLRNIYFCLSLFFLRDS